MTTMFPLPRRMGPPAYTRLLRYNIFLRVPKHAETDPLTALDWGIIGFSAADRDRKRLGTVIANPAAADPLILKLLTSKTLTEDGSKPKPDEDLLDFSTYSATLVVFRLFGALWRGAAPAITAKALQNGPGYVEAAGYRLTDKGQLERVDVNRPNCPPLTALAFEVDPNMLAGTLGINFHVEFVERRGQEHILPVVIDPNGGNGGNPPGTN